MSRVSRELSKDYTVAHDIGMYGMHTVVQHNYFTTKLVLYKIKGDNVQKGDEEM